MAGTQTAMQTKMIFCTECENLLYATTNDKHELRWTCRACKRVEIHDDNAMVYQLNMKKETGVGSSSAAAESKLLAKFAQDPTVSRAVGVQCADCLGSDVASFINPLEQPVEDMSIYFACRNPKCAKVWQAPKVDTVKR